MSVQIETNNAVWTIIIDRAEVRNAVDGPTAQALADAFRAFDADDSASVAVLSGAGGNFCAGADLKAVAAEPQRANRLSPDGDGPMGPSRMLLSKPVIAAVEGFAVAGGLELACWCDLRVVAEDATFGVFCRRFGVPLIDGGTIRLSRLVGHSRALDMILTGRAVSAEEALAFGLANRVVPAGQARLAAEALAADIAGFPQRCLREDRLSSYEQWSMDLDEALGNEFRRGMSVVESGETLSGASAFKGGKGRGGKF
ncbi:MAG: crotonase/enoyl-CoA hydratase family protein [Alcanivoracaceae bacterium]|nr:crotonase/enoyl-CoA hydratase family protein [Alcanivoracaceae bacterium]